MPFLQGFDQVRIDHRHAAPDVDEQPGRLELLEQRRIVDIVGVRCSAAG
jgi:2-keto-3-deoxy-L-rhamnonate aldolase RhmA